MALKDFEKPNNLTIPAGWWKNRQQRKSFNIRTAEKEDISALTKLYAACFGDTEMESSLFLRMAFSHPDFHLLLAEKNSLPVSMLAMVPARLAKEDRTFSRCFYLYGIGTLPAFRNQGLSGILMNCAKKMAALAGCDYLFLVPASQSLISFYEKQGFQTVPAKPAGNPPAVSDDFISISLKEYLALRANLEHMPGVFSLMEPFRTYALQILEETLYFHKIIPPNPPARTDKNLHKAGLCFHRSKNEPSSKYIEQTNPQQPSGGLLHQIFSLRGLPVPDYTYFQFPMEELQP